MAGISARTVQGLFDSTTDEFFGIKERSGNERTVPTASLDSRVGNVDYLKANGKNLPIAGNMGRRAKVVKQFIDLLGVTISTSNATVVSTIDPASPFGCPALKLVCTFSTTSGRVEVTPPALNIPAFNGHVAYTVWVDDPTKVGSLHVFIGSSAFAKYQQAQQLTFTGGDLVGGMRVVYGGPIRKNNVTDGAFVFGTDALQATKLRISSPTPIGGTATVWVKDCLIPEPQKPIVCFTWDDGFDSWVNTVMPLLQAAGVKGTFAINTDQIDKGASGITSANVATLIGQGHHVASHNIYNYKHQTLYGTGNGESNGTGTSQALAAYIADYNTARATLEAAGVDPAGLMYHPYVQGGADTGTVLAMQASGVDIARGTSPYESQLYGFELGNNALNLRAVELGNTRTLVQAKAMVDDAVTYGGLTVFMGHQTAASAADSVTWAESDLAALINYAVASGAEVLSIRQLRDRLNVLGYLTPRTLYANPGPVRCIGRLLAANMNATTDQAITLDPGQWKIEGIYATKPSVSLTTAAGGVYTAAAKGGTAIVASGQAYSTLVAATDVLAATMAATPTVSGGTIYLSLTTAQGAAATADIFVFGRPA